MIDYHELVPLPAPQDINTGLSPARPYTMLSLLGKPGALTRECSRITNPRLHAQMVTHHFNNFSVTGWRPAIDALVRAMTHMYERDRALHAVVRTAGMLCCRRVRQGINFSNHSWGTAVDFTIEGHLDQMRAVRIHRGLLEMYKYMHEEGFYWGAEFSGRPDAMHYELADETVQQLYHQYYG